MGLGLWVEVGSQDITQSLPITSDVISFPRDLIAT